MEGDQNEIPVESRNGQSACNEEDFARLIAERLAAKNENSELENSEVKSIHTIPEKPHSPPPTADRTSPEPVTTHDVGLSRSFEEDGISQMF